MEAPWLVYMAVVAAHASRKVAAPYTAELGYTSVVEGYTFVVEDSGE